MGTPELVVLDRDHPGFRDRAYRQRRDAIAGVALAYRTGEPVPRVEYTDAEHDVWRQVWASLSPLHDRYACDAYRESEAILGLDRARIPQLAEVNEALAPRTGFQMQPVAGLVSPKAFMDRLDDAVFLSTQYMRHASRPLYTPEPDVVHEIVGHAPSLIHPSLVLLNRAFGSASKRADPARIDALIRLYWYTLEFGVVEERGSLKVVGAGLLSSFGELGRFEREARLQSFDVEAIASTPFDPTAYQDTLFVAPSLERLVAELVARLASFNGE